MRILFLSRWFPYPPDNGARIRIYNLLKSLASRHEIDLISFGTGNEPESQQAGLHGVCENLAIVPYTPFKARSWKALIGYLAPYPRSVVATFSAEMQLKVDQHIRSSNYDVVIASQIDMAPYLRHLEGQCRILEELEVGVPYGQYAQSQTHI